MSETTPRAAAATGEARTPTAAQYSITAEYWKRSRGLHTMLGKLQQQPFFCAVMHLAQARSTKKHKNRTGFRRQHTRRGILTDHGWQRSVQGPAGDATRGGGSTIVVLFCTLHSALSAGCRIGSSQTELVASGHAKCED